MSLNLHGDKHLTQNKYNYEILLTLIATGNRRIVQLKKGKWPFPGEKHFEQCFYNIQFAKDNR